MDVSTFREIFTIDQDKLPLLQHSYMNNIAYLNPVVMKETLVHPTTFIPYRTVEYFKVDSLLNHNTLIILYNLTEQDKTHLVILDIDLYLVTDIYYIKSLSDAIEFGHSILKLDMPTYIL